MTDRGDQPGLVRLRRAGTSTPSPQAAYFSTPARAWELGLGAGVAAALLRHRRGCRGAPAGGRVVGRPGHGGRRRARSSPRAPGCPASPALLPVVGTALLLGWWRAAAAAWGPQRLLSVAPMRWVGDRSYSYYLWHWPALILVAAVWRHAVAAGAASLVAGGALVLVRPVLPVRREPVPRPPRSAGPAGAGSRSTRRRWRCSASSCWSAHHRSSASSTTGAGDHDDQLRAGERRARSTSPTTPTSRSSQASVLAARRTTSRCRTRSSRPRSGLVETDVRGRRPRGVRVLRPPRPDAAVPARRPRRRQDDGRCRRLARAPLDPGARARSRSSTATGPTTSCCRAARPRWCSRGRRSGTRPTRTACSSTSGPSSRSRSSGPTSC